MELGVTLTKKSTALAQIAEALAWVMATLSHYKVYSIGFDWDESKITKCFKETVLINDNPRLCKVPTEFKDINDLCDQYIELNLTDEVLEEFSKLTHDEIGNAMFFTINSLMKRIKSYCDEMESIETVCKHCERVCKCLRSE